MNKNILISVIMGVLLCVNTLAIGETIDAGTAKPSIANGGFELVAQDGKPADWVPLDSRGWDGKSADNLFYVSRDAHTGKGAAIIVLNTGSGWSASTISNLQPDTWYSISGWTKSTLPELSIGGAGIFVLQHTARDARMGATQAPPKDQYLGSYSLENASQDWTLIKLAFKTPKENAKSIYACITLTSSLEKGTALFDDLQIEKITKQEAEKIKIKFASSNSDKKLKASKNLIANSSFEIMTAPYMPDLWTHSMHYAGYKRDFYEAIRVVEDNPFHGKRCFKIKNGQIRYVGRIIGAKKLDSPSVLSFYLRTDDPESRFSVFDKHFKPEKEWKRYVVTLPAGKTSDFWVTAKGTVYLDAFQMELGDTPSVYSENYRDAALTATLPDIPLPPEVELDKIITIENLYTTNGKATAKATSCVITKNNESLHIRFECHGRNFSDLVKNITKRDDYVFIDDSVSVSINPGIKNGKDKSYIFELNAIGTKRDAFGIDATWNTEWESSTGKLEDGYWAEFTIPYAALNGAFATSTWQINLIRQSAAKKEDKKEISAWFNPGTVQVEETGILVAGFNNLNRYRVSIGQPEVELCNIRNSAPSKAYELSFEVGFADKSTKKGKAKLLLPTGTEYRARWTTENGIAFIKFNKFSEKQIGEFKNYQLTINVNGNPVAIKQFNNSPTVQPLLQVGPLDRSYYTSEKKSHLKVTIPIVPSVAKTLELDVQLLGPMERITHRRYPASSGIIDFELPELVPGIYRLKVNLIRNDSGAKVFATGEVPLTKLATAKIESKVNRINRMMVINGNEYINHGLSVSAETRTLERLNTRLTYLIPDINEIAKRFTGISPLYATLDKDREQTVPILKDLVTKFNDAGLDVCMAIPQLGEPSYLGTKTEFFQNRLGALEKHKMKEWPVVSWYEFDESYVYWENDSTRKESDLSEFYWELKKFDPHRIFYSDTCYCGRIYGGIDHADWIGGSYYPIATYPPKNLVAGVRGFAIATEKSRAMLDARVITGGFLPCFAYERGREPSAEEYRACVYVMLIHGCRAMNMWMYSVLSQTLWDSLIPLKSELEFLSPVFAKGQNISSRISGASGSIDFTVYKHENTTYLIAANYTKQKIIGSFDLNLLQSNSIANELFEKRTANIKDGILKDTFDGYGCHVYEIK